LLVFSILGSATGSAGVSPGVSAGAFGAHADNAKLKIISIASTRTKDFFIN
jgi:hypothetical protein